MDTIRNLIGCACWMFSNRPVPAMPQRYHTPTEHRPEGRTQHATWRDYEEYRDAQRERSREDLERTDMLWDSRYHY